LTTGKQISFSSAIPSRNELLADHYLSTPKRRVCWRRWPERLCDHRPFQKIPSVKKCGDIADQDGLDEQIPFRDWQGVGMV
jgi:hypothetical protein